MKSDGVLAVIPARGGSKGVANKNLRYLHGAPLVAWALRFAQESGFAFCLSSDSDEILDIGEKFDKCIIRRRPAKLATDYATDRPVLEDSLDFAEKLTGREFDTVVMLQPTAPARQAHHLLKALKLHSDSESPSNSSIWSCSPVDLKNHRAKQLYREPISGMISLDRTSVSPPRRQDLETTYIRNGDFYILGREVVLSDEYLMGEQLGIIETSKEPVNIDSEEDLLLAHERTRVHRGLLTRVDKDFRE